MPASRILVLGGTVEARSLAERLGNAGYETVLSLAGRTAAPLLPRANGVHVRIGGFGGADGLSAYLQSEHIGLVVDATHPFAAAISHNAAAAAATAAVPCFRLERRAWIAGPGDDWRIVADVTAAVAAIPPGARAFVTIGRQEITAFAARGDIHVIARMIEAPAAALPNATLILARPPFSLDGERRLFADLAVTILVAKNSGGDATAAKLAVARERRVPVIMIARPRKPAVPTFSTVDEMLAAIMHDRAPDRRKSAS